MVAVYFVYNLVKPVSFWFCLGDCEQIRLWLFLGFQSEEDDSGFFIAATFAVNATQRRPDRMEHA